MINFNYDADCIKLIKKLQSIGVTDIGCASMLGNNYTESAWNARNAQNSSMDRLKMTDEQYIAEVDSGKRDFVHDSIGFGWAQWTSPGRKQNLKKLVDERRVSIADVDTQHDFLLWELLNKYKTVLEVLRDPTKTLKECSEKVMVVYEAPANQTQANKDRRTAICEEVYIHFFIEDKAPSTGHSRRKIVEIMQGWLGATNGSAKHQDIIDTYNSYLPHPRGYKMTLKDAWCAATVSAAAIRAGYTDIIPVECSCRKLIELAQKKDIWVEDDSFTPKPGDIIIYSWDDNGIGDCITGANHTGIVETVVGTTITVIEGNYSQRCQRRTLSVNGRYIRGYIVPKYDEELLLNDNPSVVPQTVLTHVVKKGETLSAIAERYGVRGGWRTLYGWNAEKITDPNKIPVGLKLTIYTTDADYLVNLKVGDKIKLKSGATYYNGKNIPAWVKLSTLYYRGTNKNGVIISTQKTGAITGTVDRDYITTP